MRGLFPVSRAELLWRGRADEQPAVEPKRTTSPGDMRWMPRRSSYAGFAAVGQSQFTPFTSSAMIRSYL